MQLSDGQCVSKSDVDKEDRAGMVTPRRHEQAGLEASKGHRGIGIDGSRRVGDSAGVRIDTRGDVDSDDKRTGLRCEHGAPGGICAQGAAAPDAQDSVDDEVGILKGTIDSGTREDAAPLGTEGR
jgi:hypothetical protein